MFTHILIATDGSELSELAVDKGLKFAKVASARVTVVTATEPPPIVGSFETSLAFPTDQYEKGADELADKRLAVVTQKAQTLNVNCDTCHVKDEQPAEAILQVAKERNCDLIVMSTHSRRGFSRLLLGSQANKVVSHSHIPVLVCPPPSE